MHKRYWHITIEYTILVNMDDKFPKDENSAKADFEVSPEAELRGGAVNWHPDKFLGGSSERPKWENGVRKSVEVNGREWSYLEYGNPEGKPILIVHGWLGSSAEGQDHLSRAFAGEPQHSPGAQALSEHHDANRPDKPVARIIENRVRKLEGKYHIIAPDLPGFGKTEALDNISLNLMADEIAAFQKALKVENSVAFGSSMGGILVTKLAARHPEQVSAVVLQGTMTQPKDMQRMPYIAAQVATFGPIPDVLRASGFDKKLFALIVKGSKDFKIADTETQERIFSDTMAADSKTAATTLREIGKNIEEDIEKVKCPVIVIDGANADLVPIGNSAKASMRFHPNIQEPSKKFTERQVMFFPVGGGVSEQGHNVVNTYPEYVAVVVDDVLDKMTRQDQKPTV